MNFKEQFQKTSESREPKKSLVLEIGGLKDTDVFKRYLELLNTPDKIHDDNLIINTLADELISVLKEEKGRKEDISREELRDFILQLTRDT